MTIRAFPHNLGRRILRRRTSGSRNLCLEICRGQAKRKLRRISGPVFLIGSASDSDLVLGDHQFPEGYAYVYLKDDNLSIRWLGEGPELEVNDWPVQVAALKIGDRISAGPFEFRVVREDDGGNDDGRNNQHPLRIVSYEDEIATGAHEAVLMLLADVWHDVLGSRRACA